MLHVSHFVSVKTFNTLIKRSSPHSIVNKKMYKQISSVHGSSVLTVKSQQKDPYFVTILLHEIFATRLFCDFVVRLFHDT